MHPVNSQIGICGFYQAQEEQPEPVLQHIWRTVPLILPDSGLQTMIESTSIYPLSPFEFGGGLAHFSLQKSIQKRVPLKNVAKVPCLPHLRLSLRRHLGRRRRLGRLGRLGRCRRLGRRGRLGRCRRLGRRGLSAGTALHGFLGARGSAGPGIRRTGRAQGTHGTRRRHGLRRRRAAIRGVAWAFQRLDGRAWHSWTWGGRNGRHGGWAAFVGHLLWEWVSSKRWWVLWTSALKQN